MDGSAVSALDPVDDDGSTGAMQLNRKVVRVCTVLFSLPLLVVVENIFRLLVMMVFSIVCSLFFCDHHGHMKD